MKSVDDVVAELRLKVAKNLARDVCIVSIDCDDALALSQMAADFAVLLAEGKRAISALQREADGLREVLRMAREFAEAEAEMRGSVDETYAIPAAVLIEKIDAALSPQDQAKEGSER